MQLKRNSQIILILMVSAILAPQFSYGAGNDDSNMHRIELSIKQREVQIESNVLRVTQGETIELVWTSDEAGSLHLHGYDIEFEVGPDGPETISFIANATGRFPVTSHGFGSDSSHGHQAILYFEVYPD
jgi:hypothetical protein